MRRTTVRTAVFACLLAALSVSACTTLTGRTAGEIVDDSSITTAINLKIIEDTELQYLKINVNSFRGRVTLSGSIPNKSAEKRLIDLAKSVRGVKSVESFLVVETDN